MVKTCAYGKCNSDTRYPERIQGVRFIPFPKPKTQKDKCLRWIRACGRPHYQLNESRIDRHTFICTKHFMDSSGPTGEYPDPVPCDGSVIKKSRRHWRERSRQIHEHDEQQKTCTETSMGLNQAAATSVGLPVNQATEDELNPIEIDSSLLAGSLDLLTAAAQVQELQDSLKSTVETLHQQRILNFKSSSAASIIRNISTLY
ncbi:uncharacterized protein LOC134239658 [Saccostrea cucullata]|uniref:uncharacterized protein LOC134239658 n=1 Tax=Saccostrea cuccullata TaxID=36930 RepID=UPI002ED21796